MEIIYMLENIFGIWATFIIIPLISGIASILCIFAPPPKHKITMWHSVYTILYTLLQNLAFNIGNAKNAQDTKQLVPLRKIV